VSPQLHAVFNILILWDLHWLFRLERWRSELGGRVRGWFESLAQLESLCSLAALAHDRPQFTFPDLAPIGPVFIAKGLGHPLLDNPVRNDVDIPGPRHALIITGSNMSGKSTLLRSIGTNAVLALTGAPVCAQSLEVSELRVLTSMHVRDSLEHGVSHFYAEVQRIKAVLDAAAAANGRALFLLDEILWGTNTRERQIASREVLRLLLKTGASGAVSTHDLSLASLEQELGSRVRNFHFKDQLVDGEMTFDYRLRDGVLDSTNALRLLRRMGIAIEEKEPPSS
jgi:DNA mismatch repair ATPase MutS